MKLFGFVLFLFSLFISAQEERVMLNGAIAFEYDLLEFNNIKITNLSTQKSVVTNNLGRFTIKAKTQDELQITGDNIFLESYSIRNSDYTNKHFVIKLEPISIPLKDVSANKYKITGNLEQDSKRINHQTFTQKVVENVGLPMGRSAKKLDTLNYNPKFSLSVDGVMDALSGKLKKQKALYKYSQKSITAHRIKDYYGESYFTDSLGIKEENIFSFIQMIYEKSDLKSKINEDQWFEILGEIEKYKDKNSTQKAAQTKE